MAIFTLTYPKATERLSTYPIVNSDNELVCILQQVQRSTIGKIVNAAALVAIQQSLPYRYETRTPQGKLLFQVRSTLLTKGVSHQIIMPDGSCIPIQRKTVQLLESSYSFTMDGLVFRFEQDFTSTAYLYCNDEKIASAHFVNNGIVRDGIVYQLFQSDDPLFVALLASLFQTLFALRS